MALDMEKEIDRHRKGWQGFARFLFVSTSACIVALALMALFLL